MPFFPAQNAVKKKSANMMSAAKSLSHASFFSAEDRLPTAGSIFQYPCFNIPVHTTDKKIIIC